MTNNNAVMTDEQIGKMTDEEIVKATLEEETTEKPTDKPAEGSPAPAAEPEKEKSEGEKPKEEDEPKVEELTQEEIEKLPRDAKGMYFSLKKERERRHEAERKAQEREIEFASIKAKLETTEKYTQDTLNKKQIPISEHEKVLKVIQEKANNYEKEYGEEYRMTAGDYLALENAKKQDAVVERQKNEQQANYDRQEQERQMFIKRCEEGERVFKLTLEKNGDNDYEHVHKSFVEPTLMNLMKTNEAAAYRIITAMHSSDNPAEFAYSVISQMSPEGRKYFEGKIAKKYNKDLIKDDKQIPKTSAHFDSTKASAGKVRITQDDILKDDNLLASLTDEELMILSQGKEVLK